MKVVLINPPRPIKRPYFLSVNVPLNIAYLAAYLRKFAFDAEIWDYEVEKFELKSFIDRIKESKAKLIGFSCFTPIIVNGHKLASIVKENFPGIFTVVGGVHTSALPQRTLEEFPNFDFAIIGEGEVTLLKLCESLREKKSWGGLKGLAYRDGSKIIIEKKQPLIENLDTIPYPARDLLKFNLYKGTVHKGFSRSYLNIIELFTSRGCPYNCIFCASHVALDQRVRFRSVDNIIGEIEYCIKKYNCNHITILDDTFTLKPQRIRELCRYFKNRNLTWNTLGARVDTVDEGLLQEMAKGGCKGLAFGVESGSPRILKLIKKGITLKQVRNAFKWARKAGIKYLETDFIIGSHPDETEKDLKMSKDLIKELKPDILSVSYIVPYPGTEVNMIMKGMNLLPEREDWNSFSLISNKPPSWKTMHFSSEDLFKLQRQILKGYYFTPGYIFRKTLKIRTLREFFYWTNSALSFLKEAKTSKTV